MPETINDFSIITETGVKTWITIRLPHPNGLNEHISTGITKRRDSPDYAINPPRVTYHSNTVIGEIPKVHQLPKTLQNDLSSDIYHRKLDAEKFLAGELKFAAYQAALDKINHYFNLEFYDQLKTVSLLPE